LAFVRLKKKKKKKKKSMHLQFQCYFILRRYNIPLTRNINSKKNCIF
jgi:hypothetical protein